MRPRGDSYSDRQRARRGSVVAYTKGRRGSVVTYSESALKETVVRPSANLYAIASRRHLDGLIKMRTKVRRLWIFNSRRHYPYRDH